MNKEMTCPMCREGKLEWTQIKTTHVYICSESCPFVGFEYINKKDTINLSKLLK